MIENVTPSTYNTLLVLVIIQSTKNNYIVALSCIVPNKYNVPLSCIVTSDMESSFRKIGKEYNKILLIKS